MGPTKHHLKPQRPQAGQAPGVLICDASHALDMGICSLRDVDLVTIVGSTGLIEELFGWSSVLGAGQVVNPEPDLGTTALRFHQGAL